MKMKKLSVLQNVCLITSTSFLFVMGGIMLRFVNLSVEGGVALIIGFILFALTLEFVTIIIKGNL